MIWLFVLIAVVFILCLLLLSGQFRRATEERELCFPRDHGRQPEFQTEWWHFVGNLVSEDGCRWGYQVTIFRHKPALWFRKWTILRAPFDLYLAHTTITNITEKKSEMAKCMGGSVLNPGSAREGVFHVRLGSWCIAELGGRLFVQAHSRSCGLDLETFIPHNPILSHGNGLIPEKSYHYFMASLPTEGKLRWHGRSWTVRGKSWFDREFGSLMCPEWFGGWDWFALMFDDDSSIVLGVARCIEGRSFKKYCAIVSNKGTSRHLSGNNIFELTPLEYWTSPQTATAYPVRWKTVIPSIDLQMTMEAALKDQERAGLMTGVGINYWEGPVTMTGTRAQESVKGHGYAEMTGYGKPVAGKF